MKILEKQILIESTGIRITKLKVGVPEIALKAKAGHFVVVMVSERGERIPLTIVDKDKESITLIFQEAGLSTKLLGKLNKGDSLYALVGPLGNPTHIEKYGRVILVGGGVGIAEIYPVAKALKERNNSLSVILGAKTKGLLILEKELREVSDEVYLATDDGSCGKKGFVTDILQELLNYPLSAKRYRLIYAVGPIPMMQKISSLTKDSGIKVIVSLNALMVDATGMCGCCRVTVGREMKFTCVDGPEFEAHEVDWDELIKRNCIYADKEKYLCNLKKNRQL